jgi:hypothetical protein
MSGSLQPLKILTTGFKIDFVSMNIRLLQCLKDQISTTEMTQYPIKPGYGRRPTKYFSRKREPKNLLKNLRFSHLRIFLKIFKDIQYI